MRCTLGMACALLASAAVTGCRQKEYPIPGELPGTSPATPSAPRTASQPATKPASRPASQPASRPGKAVHLSILPGGTYCIGKRQFAEPGALGRYLTQIRTDNPPPVLVHAKDEVQWRWVVEGFNQAVRAGYKDIGFATESSD